MLQHRLVLGLPPKGRIDEADVRRAYRQAALAAHPDRPTGDAAAFRQVQLAYEVLTGAASPPRPEPKRSSSAAASRRNAPTTMGVAKCASPSSLAPFARQPREAFAATLRGGTIYTFDVGAALVATGLRHGDTVQRPHSSPHGTTVQRGTIVGIAANGVVYWWRSGDTEATPFGSPAMGLPSFTKVGVQAGSRGPDVDPRAPDARRRDVARSPPLPPRPTSAAASKPRRSRPAPSAASEAPPANPTPPSSANTSCSDAASSASDAAPAARLGSFRVPAFVPMSETPPNTASTPLAGLGRLRKPSFAGAMLDSRRPPAAPSGVSPAAPTTVTPLVPTTSPLLELERCEAAARMLFLQRWLEWVAEASWLAHLARFAPLDRQFNERHGKPALGTSVDAGLR